MYTCALCLYICMAERRGKRMRDRVQASAPASTARDALFASHACAAREGTNF